MKKTCFNEKQCIFCEEKTWTCVRHTVTQAHGHHGDGPKTVKKETDQCMNRFRTVRVRMVRDEPWIGCIRSRFENRCGFGSHNIFNELFDELLFVQRNWNTVGFSCAMSRKQFAHGIRVWKFQIFVSGKNWKKCTHRPKTKKKPWFQRKLWSYRRTKDGTGFRKKQWHTPVNRNCV